MFYGEIPHLDKQLSKLVMGVIPLPQNDLPKAFSILDAYRAAGGNVIDNSRVYGNGFASVMKAYYALHGQDVLIRLDKGNHHGSNDDQGRRVTKEALDADIAANLEQQGVDYSDIYLLHRDDPRVPVGDVVEWLNENVAAGRVKAFGGSNWHHTRIEAANEYADKYGMQGFSASSPNLSLATANEAMWWEALSISKDLAAREWYRKSQIPVFSWSSGGGGFFAGVESPDVKRVYFNDTNFARKARLQAMASEKGVTPTQLAVAWTLNQPLNIWALIGPGTPEQVQDNVQSIEIKLTQQELDYLENG
jgi:aryl-alcohol dehydrogenase-like predicted oxidoreductase